MLEASPQEGAEECAIHDHEGYGSYRVSEYEGIQSAHEVACFIEEHGDFAEELTSEVPEHLAFYIDYERMGRDMELSGDVFTVETGYQEVHVFWSH